MISSFVFNNQNTKSGYELIAHEVTHTVQQASGQVSPGIDASSSLELTSRTQTVLFALTHGIAKLEKTV